MSNAIKLAYEIKNAISSLAERESAFERSFADIAHAIIRDKAPRLADYEVGFQVIDKEPDNSRATGVMAFKVGEQWLFVPFFFLNGDVRGYDILIVRDGDLMLPLKDNWLDYIFSTSTRHSLGEKTEKSVEEKGPRPDLYNSLTPYPLGYKYASDRHAWFANIVKKARSKLDGTVNIRWFIAGPRAVDFANTLLKIAKARPEIAAFIEQNYGIRTIVKEAKASYLHYLPKKNIVNHKKVRVYTPIDLDAKPHVKLAALRNGFVVEDRRSPDELSKLIDTSKAAISELSFRNPDSPGLHDVLVLKNGKLSVIPALVLKQNRFNKSDHELSACCSGRSASSYNNTEMFVLSLSDSNKNKVVGFYAPARSIWTVNERVRTYHSDEPSSVTQALNKVSIPFEELTRDKIVQNVKDNNGFLKLYFIFPGLSFARHEVYIGTDKNGNPEVNIGKSDNSLIIKRTSYVDKFILTRGRVPYRETTESHTNQVTWYLPQGTRVILERNEFQPGGKGRPRDAISPAKVDWTDHVFFKRGYDLKVHFDGTTYYINGEACDTYEAPKVLVYKHNLGEEDARYAIKKARDGRTFRGFVVFPKKAVSSVPSSETDFFGYRAEVPARQAEVIDELSAVNSDPSGYNPLPSSDRTTLPPPPSPNDPDIRRMSQAAREGKKDVFDLAGISALTSHVGIDNIVSEYSRKVFKAMDAAGRLLFLFYRFRPEFAERIGETDAPRFENLLREVFDRLGDLSILLREKVSATPEGERGTMDIEAFQGEL